MKFIGMIVGLVLLAGCVTRGAPFVSEVSWIKIDSTSQDNVYKMLGNPHAVGNSSGTPTWTYGYYRYGLIGVNAQKELKFYWNQNKTVKDFSFNSSFPDDRKPSKVTKENDTWQEP